VLNRRLNRFAFSSSSNAFVAINNAEKVPLLIEAVEAGDESDLVTAIPGSKVFP